MNIEADKAAILALVKAVQKGHRDKDAAAIVAEYAKDAVVFDLAPPLISPIGTDARAMKAWFDTWDGPIDLAARDFEITIGGDIAFCHGFYELSGTPKAAEGQRISLWMRATLCLSRQGATWKIVHEHTSVPFYMDGSFRAALDLKP